MKTIRVTMTVEEIRKATVDQKVRIQYHGLPTTEEFLKVLRVEEPSGRQRSKRGMICTMCFEGGGYLSIHTGDVIEVFEEGDAGERYES